MQTFVSLGQLEKETPKENPNIFKQWRPENPKRNEATLGAEFQHLSETTGWKPPQTVRHLSTNDPWLRNAGCMISCDNVRQWGSSRICLWATTKQFDIRHRDLGIFHGRLSENEFV